MSTKVTKKTLTPDQQKAADAFFDFLISDENIFVLSGGAGVGKTFLMQYLCNDMMLTYERSCALLDIKPKQYDVHFTATTNKAAEVLERSVNREVQTIHTFLGLKVFPDYKTGKEVIRPAGNGAKNHRNIILFIDESSMIDEELLDYIKLCVKDSKIIFVGDKAQLAPVNEDLSPVFKNVNPSNFIHLTQSVRNANSPALMDLCAQLRHTVQTGEFFKIQEVPGSIEYLDNAQMQKKLMAHFFCPNDDARILCYTNTRVAAFNDYVREIRDLPPHIIKGDILVAAKAYMLGKATLSVEREMTVLTVNPEIQTNTYPYGKDGQIDIDYRVLTVQPKASFMGPTEVRVPLDKEKLDTALRSAKARKDWDSFFSLKNGYADLRGKEACTVYKSQGSTYDTVFIDLGNIGISRDAQQVARMLFVAASRATTKVYLYGQLPGKYKGKSCYDPTVSHSVAAE